ncbi:hypothetical protein ACFLY7_02015 [Patescibacteria group bacterium]
MFFYKKEVPMNYERYKKFMEFSVFIIENGNSLSLVINGDMAALNFNLRDYLNKIRRRFMNLRSILVRRFCTDYCLRKLILDIRIDIDRSGSSLCISGGFLKDRDNLLKIAYILGIYRRSLIKKVFAQSRVC